MEKFWQFICDCISVSVYEVSVKMYTYFLDDNY